MSTKPHAGAIESIQALAEKDRKAAIVTHSPGPWSVDLRFGDAVIRDAAGNDVVTLPKWMPDFQAERNANAHLIGAGPAMLAALRVALVALTDANVTYAMAEASAAIAQAEGQP